MCCDKQDVSWLVVKKQKNSCGLGRVSSWLVRKHAQQKADSTVKRAGVGSEMDTSLYRGSSGQVCVSHVYSIDAALFTQFSWCHRRPSERRLAVTSCINCCKNWHRLARAEWAQTSSYCYVTLSTHPLEDTFKPSILSTSPHQAQKFWLISNSLYSVKVAITIVTLEDKVASSRRTMWRTMSHSHLAAMLFWCAAVFLSRLTSDPVEDAAWCEHRQAALSRGRCVPLFP